MIGLARIQGHTMGFSGLQKPVIQALGQNGNGNGNGGPSPSPSPSPAPAPSDGFNFAPIFPQIMPPPTLVFPVTEAPAPAPQIPSWAPIALASAAGAAVLVVVVNALRKN